MFPVYWGSSPTGAQIGFGALENLFLNPETPSLQYGEASYSYSYSGRPYDFNWMIFIKDYIIANSAIKIWFKKSKWKNTKWKHIINKMRKQLAVVVEN